MFNIAAAFLTQTVCLDDTTVKFEIWDTAGQERYHSLAPMYYRGAQAAIVVYDITNPVSFVPIIFSILFLIEPIKSIKMGRKRGQPECYCVNMKFCYQLQKSLS